MKEIKNLFKDTNRTKELSRSLLSEEGSLLIDYSKTHIEKEDISKWITTLEQMQIGKRVQAMFSGEKINYTEERQVLHVKLRSSNVISYLQGNTTVPLDTEEKQIVEELKKMKTICDSFENNQMKGPEGNIIRNVIGIGIGGSDLGPRMLTSSICGLTKNKGKERKEFKYVSNVDAQEIFSVLEDISLKETVFVVVSKTFTTQETLENAKIALDAVVKAYPDTVSREEIVKRHFLAVSAAKEKAVEFGILSENVLDMWDYVGGRYSIWSCVSLTSAMHMGFDSFLAFLSGASLMDSHFLNTPIQDNIPMMHALVECMYYNKYMFNNKCIVPYDNYLRLLPNYLQQCEMESNGKSSTKDGKILFTSGSVTAPVNGQAQTAPIIWGGIGTDVQHSYFQALHQGTNKVLTEFLIPLTPRIHSQRKNTEESTGTSSSHDVLLSNCLAQSRALMLGRQEGQNERYFSGNRPSITIIYNKLTPFTLGLLLALYEHKIFIQGQVWNINSYDQFGVELGKVLAKEILSEVEKNHKDSFSFDPSTNLLLEYYQKHKQ
ncbi:glucose-6-phosphate isomerase [Nematocida sp. AWRm80]|nr:glucose-6-phosphate isomerase [Nematocida sp. AWRm80]